MKRTKWNPRKVLIASAGVASVNYAIAAGCGGEGAGTVANLVPCPPSQCPEGNGSGGASVANLVAPPPTFGGRGGVSGDGGATVANLVAPPPAGAPNLPDASAPDTSPDDAGALDAGADGAA